VAWFKVDDSFHQSRKVLSIPRRDRAAAIGLWTLAGGWCASQLTDGRLGAHLISEFGSSRKYADILVSVGLWERVSAESGSDPDEIRSETDSFQFHNWARWQPTRDHVLGEREAARERMQRVRSRRSSPEQPANFARSSEEVRLTPSRPDPSVVPNGTTKAAPKRAIQLPADWQPKDDHLAIAREYNLDPAFELRKFRDHHEAKGSTMKSWDAAFRTWLNNAKTYQRPASRAGQLDWDAALQRADARTEPNHLEIA
jgi:hypothetical protein